MKNLSFWVKLMRIGNIMGCHQLPERSFFFKKYQFPVCARCTGVIISSIIAIFTYFFYPINIITAFLLSFIMFLDWFIQFLKIKPSTNSRRLITGIIGGYGVATIQMYIYTYLFKAICTIFN
ncbi:MAG: DUF2085 domain-containing protein [Lachnospiraceae bacterium]|nr:DUF2085 domain-containing protein [Lachnospiraceae bacterium]